MYSKLKILDSIVYIIYIYVISHLLFFEGRQISQREDEMLPKVSPKGLGTILGKFWEFTI